MAIQLKFKVPGLDVQSVPITEPRMIVGTLLSNHVVIRAPGVEPIHAMVESSGEKVTITDLGSVTGVKINGKRIEVESVFKVGDTLTIGSVEIIAEPYVEAAKEVVSGGNLAAPPPPVPPQNLPPTAKSKSALDAASGGFEATRTSLPAAGVEAPRTKPMTQEAPQPMRTVRAEESSSESEDRRVAKKDLLFSPRKARPSGDILEVVAYWGDTVLEVELFHPILKGFERVTIGDPTKAHFIAAGDENVSNHVLAAVGNEGYALNLLDGMETRLRQGGNVEKVSGKGSYKLGRRDIAHIKYGPVSYFFLFVRPPVIQLPRSGPKDPVLMMLTTLAMIMYLTVIPLLWFSTAKDQEKDPDDIWSLIQVPKKEEPPKPVPKPKVEIAEVKTPPPTQKPPPPKPKEVEPAKTVEKEKPKQVKPVEKPVEKPLKATEALAKEILNKAVPEAPKVQDETRKEGMASTGAKNPDFKKAGPPSKNPDPRSGGMQGSGMNQTGGERKGNQAISVKGVEGKDNNKASGPNLDKLGLGVGKILSKTGPGAIATNFQSSAGGAGGGSGSGSRTYGLGGVGSNKSLGIAGAGTAANNFGQGSGGFGGGEGGTGGLGGSGLGKNFGADRGRANVEIPAGDAVVDGGLTQQEIMAVIRSNLNQIRHCYEQLLQRSPSASGKLKVEFVINASGRVDRTDVISNGTTISDSLMRGCVTGRIARWNFPKPRGAPSVTVKYPFVFTPL